MDDPSSAKETISPFAKLLVSLSAAGIDYAVVGGVAVILNGYIRVTEDVDIIIDERADNVRNLLRVLENFGEGHARELAPEEFVPQEGSIRIFEEFALDVFTRMRGRALGDFRSSLRYHELASQRIPYISPESLIYLKSGSWRDKDKLDVLAMREIIAREAAANQSADA